MVVHNLARQEGVLISDKTRSLVKNYMTGLRAEAASYSKDELVEQIEQYVIGRSIFTRLWEGCGLNEPTRIQVYRENLESRAD